jgi:hypothetical protein
MAAYAVMADRMQIASLIKEMEALSKLFTVAILGSFVATDLLPIVTAYALSCKLGPRRS